MMSTELSSKCCLAHLSSLSNGHRAQPLLNGLLLSLSVLLASCTAHRSGIDVQDGPPRGQVNVDHVQEVTPKAEPLSRYGNHSPYVVNDKVYHVMDTARGYQERGIASWYGTKFHGRRTSSWEPYDLMALTAAHKTLPLPTYVRVRNLENGRELIVRVNDRGPFHDDRIIDLSYAAAVKLGFSEQGTARVEVEALTSHEMVADAGTPQQSPVFLQAGAFIDELKAQQLQFRLSTLTHQPVTISSAEQSRAHRVRIGPFDTEQEAKVVRDRIIELQLANPIVIR